MDVSATVERPPLRLPIDEDGTILITGATGGIGALLARHLAERGVRHLTLVSRRGPAAESTEQLVAELAERGCEARLLACDVGDRDACAALVADVSASRPIRAVVHAAGVLDDATIASLTAEQVERVLHAKTDAAWHLYELTEGLDLTAFVSFSSLAALAGAPGQGNYAAANAFLDALAQRARAAGRTHVSIA
jgi:NAD(P)-dependent dehydrogenase (short-subunit alcohol dehydrogenase family)